MKLLFLLLLGNFLLLYSVDITYKSNNKKGTNDFYLFEGNLATIQKGKQRINKYTLHYNQIRNL